MVAGPRCEPAPQLGAESWPEQQRRQLPGQAGGPGMNEGFGSEKGMAGDKPEGIETVKDRKHKGPQTARFDRVRPPIDLCSS